MMVDEIEKVLRGKFPKATYSADETFKTGVKWSVLIAIPEIREAARAFEEAVSFWKRSRPWIFRTPSNSSIILILMNPGRVQPSGSCAATNRVPIPSSIFFAGPAGWNERSTTFSE